MERPKGRGDVKKITVGVAAVFASLLVGVASASASLATVKNEQKFINAQVKYQIFPKLNWKSCSGGECAKTDGGAKTGNYLAFGLYGTTLTLTETGATNNSSVLAAMDQVIGQIVYQYAGTKAAEWSGKVADDGTPVVNDTKSFGSWSVQVLTSSSKSGSIVVTLKKD
jgi:hypothetical protein